jgi:hypothetical protein
MRNYVKVAYCRLTFASYQDGDWNATFNKDIIGENDEDCVEQVANYIASFQVQAFPGQTWVVWDEPIEDRFVELNKSNLIKLMKIGTALQQVSTDNSKTWMEGNNQAGINIDRIWVRESPRITWSHGH